MSLPPELWDALRLDDEVVRARAEYFTSFARSDAPLFEADGLIQALRDGPIASGENAVVSLFSREESAPLTELRRRIADVGEGLHHPRWVRVAERADALRHAAVAELLYDTSAGTSTLLRSAGEYRRLGLPFGALLETAATGSRENAFRAGRHLRILLNPEFTSVPTDESVIPLEEALSAPAQQVAVLLTAMSQLEAIYEWRTTVDTLAAAAQAGGSAPVGATAQPIALWWECGRLLFELAGGRSDARERLRDLIVELAAAHGTSLRNAQYDDFHWSAAISRVDLVDLDLACLVAVSVRLLRQLQEPPWDMIDDFDDVSELSRVSLTVGLDLAGGRGRRGTAAPAPRPGPGPAFGPRPDRGQESRDIIF